ncbi:hypothetical protein [Sinorhizobium meliloti]|uniref:hypothetical protein n=1 Tax=Rhizobium meliloti TaxID=382 RepID=UPI001F3FF89A|nr:hypothetical protein [Sinorhizobium meliloti]
MLISASPTRSSNPLIILAGGSYEEASSVARSLREIGYSCVCSPDYRTFEQHARLVKPDLLLLDSDIHGEFLRVGLEKVSTISISCKASGEHADVGDGDPRFC